MPIMHVHHVDGTLPPDAKTDLAKRLTDVLIAMEGGANTRGGRGFAFVLFSPIKPGDWWVGGETGDGFVYPPGRFVVHVSIPEGYMNAPHKSEVHAWVNDAILKATGCDASPDAGRSILVVIDEVPEGNWGVAGKTISLASIAQSVGLSDVDRVNWTKAYFAAKARAFEAAGYPNDIGGLAGNDGSSSK
jgi:phenylpyruvate tautomerase PptA (4-oxalocrotonate tautomerase family)